MPRRSEASSRLRRLRPTAALALLAALPFLCHCSHRTDIAVIAPSPAGSSPSLETTPFPPAPYPERGRPCVFTGVETIVAVGDIHGAYDAFVDILKTMGLVDRHLRWTGGRTHLVQMGDVMDRGPKARAVIDLIRRLEREAEEDGGAVHMLLGNHEEMNILGYSFETKGYVTPEQFRDFLPSRLRDRKDAEFQSQAPTYQEYNRLWQEYMDGNPQARDLYTNTFNRTYGRWLAGRPVVIKINDTVFVHGGLTEALSVLSCETINASLSLELERYLRKEDFDWAWIYQPRGPLWYRDLALTPEETLRDEVDRILANLKARAIVIGHSPAPAYGLNPLRGRFGGKVWTIDTGIWMKDGGTRSALVIKNDEIRLIMIGKGEER
ncbi:MAG: metallophosphoesterase [Candidatus Aminicenantes bacterium]|nr:metallophosphoesterase [Candidatus Aminicenantes bacterium]